MKRLEAENRRLRRKNRRLVGDNLRLKRENAAVRKENRRLKSELERSRRRERTYRRQAWGRKSEKMSRPKAANAASPRPKKTSDQAKPRQKRGPKPFDPALPREKVMLPDPPEDKLRCPVTEKLMKEGFTETVEVLRIIPARAIVQQYERRVFVSPAKTAPVCTPWPEDISERAGRLHVQVRHLPSKPRRFPSPTYALSNWVNLRLRSGNG
ncbi:MAG: hypothetical protein ACREFX_04515 [Opitutaceae bacterium]